jgi:hypothetical protein
MFYEIVFETFSLRSSNPLGWPAMHPFITFFPARSYPTLTIKGNGVLAKKEAKTWAGFLAMLPSRDAMAD